MNALLQHIVFLTPGFAASEQDSTTIPALQIYIKALKKQCPTIKITIIAFQFPFTDKSYPWNGFTVIPLNGRNKKWKKPFVWSMAYSVLTKLHSQNPIAVIHSFWLGECALVGHLFTKKYAIKSITTLMGQDVGKGNLYGKILPLHRMTLVCASANQQQRFKENYTTSTEIIPWGINPEEFPVDFTKKMNFISVGSLNTIKNHDLFIEIISKINNILPVKAIIIGEGNEREKLEKKIISLQLEDVIALKGMCSYDETLNYIAQSKILLHTSNYEGFGMIFAEALQCKTMIVSKNVGMAFQCSNWYIGATKDELVEGCLSFTNRHFSEMDANPFVVEKTIADYLKIYNE